MKKEKIFTLLIALLLFPFGISAQEISKCIVDSLPNENEILETDSMAPRLVLPTPPATYLLTAPGFDGCSPWFMGSYGPAWELHQGFNAQLGMSVTAGLGKHAPSGVGFGQHAAFAYALPLNQRFSVAGGLYAQNMDWGSFHTHDVGIAAVLGFKVNEKVSLYAYGTKSLVPQNRRQPVGYFPLFMDNFRDRIGAMAEFKLGEKAKIQISVERGSINFRDVPGVGTMPTDGFRDGRLGF